MDYDGVHWIDGCGIRWIDCLSLEIRVNGGYIEMELYKHNVIWATG